VYYAFRRGSPRGCYDVGFAPKLPSMIWQSNMPITNGSTEDENRDAPAGDGVRSSLVPRIGVKFFYQLNRQLTI